MTVKIMMLLLCKDNQRAGKEVGLLFLLFLMSWASFSPSYTHTHTHTHTHTDNIDASVFTMYVCMYIL